MSQTIALITGAGSGLGLACAYEFTARGIPVLMVSRTMDTSVSVKKQSSAAYSLAADVGNPSDIQKIRQFVNSENHQVKWLVNNAGAGRFGDIGKYSPEDIEETLNGNLKGLIYMSQAFADMITANNGVICNIMSTAALNFRPQETIYTAAKWGARGFTEALRAELKGKTIKIMAVYPGGMNTNFWDESRHYVPDSSKFMDPSVVAERIVSNILDSKSCQVSDLTINRP